MRITGKLKYITSHQSCPLDEHDWWLVMYFSFPVILIDEILTFFGRITTIDQYAKLRKLEKDD
jgi:hypothetical protein